MQHFQFGAGHFGLGFGVWLFSKANIPSVIVARSSADQTIVKPNQISPQRRNHLLQTSKRFVIQYKIASKDAQTTSNPSEIVKYEDFVTYDELRPQLGLLDKRFSQNTPLVFTFSLGNLKAYETPLRYVLRASDLRAERNILQPIFLMAFENAIPTSAIFKKLLDMAGKEQIDEVFPLEVCVDRVCAEFSELSSPDRKPLLQIMAEPHASLVIEDSGVTAALESALAKLEQVTLSPHIEFERMRKRWLLNGSHALLGITAIYYGIAQFHEFFIMERLRGGSKRGVPELSKRQQFARDIIHELAVGYVSHLKKTEDGRAYVQRYQRSISEYESQIFDRFCSTYDSTNRIMKNYVSPRFERDPQQNTIRIVNTMEQFFTWMRPKMDEPVKAYMSEHKAAPPNVTLALLHLFELIAGGRFLDTIELV